MKKLISGLILVTMICALAMFPASATSDSLPIDITDQMKWATAYTVYSELLPVVRHDATFVGADEYDMALSLKAPSGGARTIKFTDLNAPYFFEDPFNLGDGDFYYYTTKWANIADPDDRAKLTYYFDVAEAGTYEFVFIGAAQIKEADVDNDEKDRGFAYSVDDGQKYQVNISDTEGIFREYQYTYGKAELDETRKITANGTNSYYFQATYFYNITADLTAGQHTLEFYDLFYSGETTMTGNGARLNYMGFYVQKALSDIDWELYTYPETTTAPVTEPPVTAEPITTPPVTTEKPIVTEAPEEDDTTVMSGTDSTAAPTTDKSADSKGCKSSIGLGALALLVPAAAVLIKKKKD